MSDKTDAEIVAEIIEAWDAPTDWVSFGKDVHQAIATRLTREVATDREVRG